MSDNKKREFNFIGNRNKAFIVSGILFLITIISLAANKGPKLSIDFTGGTSLIVPFVGDDIEKELTDIQASVAALNFDIAPEVRTFEEAGSTYLQFDVNGGEMDGVEIKNKIIDVLNDSYPELGDKEVAENITFETVGPRVGQELKTTTVYAIIMSLIVIVFYIAIRFKLAYGIAAIAALFHDVVVTFGLFSVLGWEISLPIIAAILTIVGYSLNDTIVVFDRVRENLTEKDDKNKSFEDKINSSINQTLSRTLITSLTTLVVVATIFAFFFDSTNVLKYFSGALIVGILSGTYSSIYIASPVLVLWNRKWPLKK